MKPSWAYSISPPLFSQGFDIACNDVEYLLAEQ